MAQNNCNIAKEDMVFELNDVIEATRTGVCGGQFCFDVNLKGSINGSDGRNYQFYDHKHENFSDVPDIREIYCHSEKWSIKRYAKRSEHSCGNYSCGKAITSWCGRCKKEGYCSVDCQKRCWPLHGRKCRNSYSETDFWRWFSTGKCSIFHYALAETIRQLMRCKNEPLKEFIGIPSGARVRVVFEHRGETYEIEDAFISGSYRHVNKEAQERLGYKESVYIYNKNFNNYKDEKNLTLNSFSADDMDRMGHVSEGAIHMFESDCVNSYGERCSKKYCVNDAHLGVHQLCVLRVRKYWGGTDKKGNTANTSNETDIIYVDMAGMQYGHDEILVLSKKDLPEYYAKQGGEIVSITHDEELWGYQRVEASLPEDLVPVMEVVVKTAMQEAVKVRKERNTSVERETRSL